MTYSEDQIKSMVREVLLRTLGPNGVVASSTGSESKTHGLPGTSRPDSPARPSSGAAAAAAESSNRVAQLPSARPTVTELDVRAVPQGGKLTISPGAIITPLARDTALDRQVTLVSEPDIVAQGNSYTSSSHNKPVALGADHGGYVMKEDLKAYLGELGYEILDCGTHSTESVDYPDFAYAVAKLVSEGRAWRGVIVDGAGIGSCMAANKVPGVRAAMCYDHATASNSREHNDANVLTLGGVLIGRNLARQIAKTWLEAEFGGDRHARRVDKIMQVERRFMQK